MEKIQLENFTWIDIEKPTAQDITFLDENYKFHHLALEDCLSNIQRPKLDQYDNYLFMVFHLPRHVKPVSRTMSEEIDIFLGKNYLITVHENNLRPVNDLMAAVKTGDKNIITKSPAYLLYELFDKSFDYCFPMTDKIGQKLDGIEDRLYKNQTRQTLENITVLERDIINFRRIIMPQIRVMKDLENVKAKYIGEGLDIYFDDVVDKIERINELLDSYKDVCEALQRTNESVLTQKLNEIMKLLTVFSVLMLPLTVITGFYGMNVAGLPISDHKFASEIILGILALVIVAMLVFFRKKDWL